MRRLVHVALCCGVVGRLKEIQKRETMDPFSRKASACCNTQTGRSGLQERLSRECWRCSKARFEDNPKVGFRLAAFFQYALSSFRLRKGNNLCRYCSGRLRPTQETRGNCVNTLRDIVPIAEAAFRKRYPQRCH